MGVSMEVERSSPEAEIFAPERSRLARAHILG
jgi:hypothetical protein